jgi:chromosome segregation ATPase
MNNRFAQLASETDAAVTSTRDDFNERIVMLEHEHIECFGVLDEKVSAIDNAIDDNTTDINRLFSLREEDCHDIDELVSRLSELEKLIQETAAKYEDVDDTTDDDEEEVETDQNVSNMIFFLALFFEYNMSIPFCDLNRLI